MTDTLNTILGWVAAGALGVFGLGVFGLHQWLRSRELGEQDDEDDDDFFRPPSDSALKHLNEWRNRR